MKKKLLLHICCGPCAIYVFGKLQAEYEVTGFYYNPNIHPAAEYWFRRQEIEKLSVRLGWAVVYPPYEPEEWFAKIKGMESEPERGGRCPVCFRQRLEATFRFARDQGYECVASTLSISPYKVTGQINRVGSDLETEWGIPFLPEDFKKRDGFRISRQRAEVLGVKHQEYCGCVFSLRPQPRHGPKLHTGQEGSDIQRG